MPWSRWAARWRISSGLHLVHQILAGQGQQQAAQSPFVSHLVQQGVEQMGCILADQPLHQGAAIGVAGFFRDACCEGLDMVGRGIEQFLRMAQFMFQPQCGQAGGPEFRQRCFLVCPGARKQAISGIRFHGGLKTLQCVQFLDLPPELAARQALDGIQQAGYQHVAALQWTAGCFRDDCGSHRFSACSSSAASRSSRVMRPSANQAR